MILARAINNAKSVDGEKVRNALNDVVDFQGTSGLYNFKADHRGVTKNPYACAQIIDGKILVVK